jgi:glycosyltransferase involved in cell wall biosynthesis
MTEKISVCLITKDNGKTLESCLKSIKSLADEIILVDTGSSDNTKEIAHAFNAKIYDFKWTDNFSEAKNHALEHASYPWIFEIDADETISQNDKQKIKELTDSKDYLGFYFIQRNYTNEIGSSGWTSSKDDFYEESKIASGFVPRKMVRLYKNDKRIRKSGVVHDSVIKSIEKIGFISDTDIPVHHFGYLNRSKERTRRYIELEEKNITNDYFQEYQLASQLREIGEANRAIQHLLKSLELNQNFHLSWLEMATIWIQNGKISEAKPLLLRSLELKEDATTLSQLGIVSFYEKNFNESISYLERAIKLNEKNADFHFNLSRVYKQLENKQKADEELNKAIYLNEYYKKYLS